MHMAATAHQTASDEVRVANADDHGAPMSPVHCAGTGHNDGCRLPFAPGQCSSMSACDISATPVGTIAASTYLHTIALELPSLALEHSGPTFAPELPPPRA